MLESLFNKIADFIKKRLQLRYFPVNIVTLFWVFFFFNWEKLAQGFCEKLNLGMSAVMFVGFS